MPPTLTAAALLRIVLGAVDVGPRRGVQDEVAAAARAGGGSGDVPVRARRAPRRRRRGERLRERAAELAAGARDQDAAAGRAAERIGVWCSTGA